MTIRTRTHSVHFHSPFHLSGVEGLNPAGDYTLETDDELVPDLSFSVYKRIRTSIRVSSGPGVSCLVEVAPDEVAALLARPNAERTA